ncbi:xanthine dehydrogenase accessory protein XdhC [Mesorhizobium sp. SB112]|uniref:xanthine dehydrogenase accessory protein XdhC n=1 Tax=Mesorhizobium sp. SB112 TaxID=3151853 RepID=UPI003263AC8E
MTATAPRLRAFLDSAGPAALVEVADAKGSTPRERGAQMLVSAEGIFGTIGGGTLEFMAIDRAREMLREDGQADAKSVFLDVPLGPEIGQCCGGRVSVQIRPIDPVLRQNLVETAEAEDARRPHVYVFGGGHVGHALSSAFALLPLHVTVIETRADALEGMPETVATRLTPVPEQVVRSAPSGSAFVILTHDHALDFLIVSEALVRTDAAYVGMIGSKTKKATFRSWFEKNGGNAADFSRLICPIGGETVKDKRPAVIAALAAAEIMTALFSAVRKA